MFIGHYGPAFALKAVSPKTPLWVLFVAVQIVDIALSFFLRFGIERMRIDDSGDGSFHLDIYFMPYTHGLPAVLAWSFACGLLYRWLRPKDGLTAAIVVGVAVFSHWLGDLIAHPPDLPLWGNSHKVGLDLWRFGGLALVVELALFLGGLALYLRASVARSIWGWIAPLAFAAVLVGLHSYGYFNRDARPATFDSVTIFGMTVFFVIAGFSLLVEGTRTPKIIGRRSA